MEVVRRLQISLADQLDQAFTRTYNELSVELAARDAIIRQAEEKTKLAEEARQKAVQRSEELQRENEWLREEFWEDPTNTDGQTASVVIFNDLQKAYDPEKILATINDDHLNVHDEKLLEAHRSVGVKYRSLYAQVQELAKASDTLRRKVKQAKEKMCQWQECFSREEFTVPVRGANITFKRAGRTGGFSHEGRESSLSLPQPSDFTPVPPSDLKGRSDHEKPRSHLAMTPSISRPETLIKVESDENQVDLSILQPSDSTPTASQSSSDSHTAIVANLPKKRSDVEPVLSTLSRGEAVQTGTDTKLEVIKCEQISSSDLRDSLTGQESGPPGTQDLEDIGDIVETPRKHVRWDNDLHRSPTFGVFHDSRSGSFTLCHNKEPFSAWKTTGRQTALRMVDTNRASTCEPKLGPDLKRRKTNGRAEHAIPHVAEDGEENYAELRTERVPRPNTPSNGGLLNGSSASTKRRLDDLLAAPSPQKSPLVLSKAQKAPARQGQQLQSGPGISFAYAPSRRYRGHDPEERSRQYSPNHDHVPRSLDPEDEPYRCRPVHRLGLDCFKINSEYNQGLNFAFDEVVRKKEQRKCLTGCTRPDCCGDKFRAMARAGGLATVQRSAVNQTDSEGDEDRQILEDYMGDQKHKLDTMSEEERNDLLIEAKARMLANQYGKHRHAHERPRSPPGFWRTDMPDTQELERDQEEARKLEREKVMERYREAMRPGGLWKFSDEP